MRQKQVLPAVLTDSLAQAKQMVSQASKWQTGLHVDVIDGRFADNLTLLTKDWANLGEMSQSEVHLMVTQPMAEAKQAVAAGFGRILAQIETLDRPLAFAQEINNAKREAGVVLDLSTPVSALQPDWCQWLDEVLLMSVNAGFGGQKFSPKVTEKLQALINFRKHHKLNFAIGMDGGIKPAMVRQLIDQGVDRLVMGSGIWAADQPDRVWQELQQVLSEASK